MPRAEVATARRQSVHRALFECRQRAHASAKCARERGTAGSPGAHERDGAQRASVAGIERARRRRQGKDGAQHGAIVMRGLQPQRRRNIGQRIIGGGRAPHHVPRERRIAAAVRRTAEEEGELRGEITSAVLQRRGGEQQHRGVGRDARQCSVALCRG